MLPEVEVAIVGSGPNALSLAAQLRARKIEFRVFGPPMKFWRDMPSGIHLKSFAFATNVCVPESGHTFPEWCRRNGLEDHEPCTMESFARYGAWMQQRFVPELEPVGVARVSAAPGGFELALADERGLRARRVVFATGLSHLEHTPGSCRRFPRSSRRTRVPRRLSRVSPARTWRSWARGRRRWRPPCS